MRSLERYAVEAGAALGGYADQEGRIQRLNATGWEHVRGEMLGRSVALVHLVDASVQENRFGFEYFGGRTDEESGTRPDTEVCAMCFWLPTEYLEEHGPTRVRELALELLGTLPICSGNVGLALNVMWVINVRATLPELCLRYLGLDLPDAGRAASCLGTRVMGPSWLTFLGQPALGELGGVAGLRSRLHTPGTTVEALEGDRAVVRLGEWPEAGDLQEGRDLPTYRELARALEPCLYRETRQHYAGYFRSAEELRRWERRFLD